ncbi:MAG: galactokinase [Clostridia bacterium]|nr:galactokinase [Clostridia bacterium]
MNTKAIIEKIKNGGFDSELTLLAYPDIDKARERLLKAVQKFVTLFGDRECVYIISAPGRTELSGNHTDHQGGCVLAGSVNLDTLAVVSPREDKAVTVASEGYEPFTVTLDTLEPIEAEKGHSEAIVRGVAAVIGCVKGFDAYTTSNVPKGSGLSSSAAFEVLIGKILTFLSGKEASPMLLAETGHIAEVKYFGKPCGKMDQYACATGGVVFLDFKTEDTYSKAISVDFEALGYTLVITNAGGSHAHLTPEYASVPEEMREVARALGKSRLSEIPTTEFFRKFSTLRGRVSDRALSRALHYYTEIDRVEKQAEALEKGDIDTYLENMQGSGDSSLLNLQNIYPTVDINERSLSLALGVSKLLSAVSRVHGGGFAGTIQALVKNGEADSYIEEMDKVFGKGSAVAVKIRPVGAYVLGEEN